MDLSNLTPAKGSVKSRKRIGRGEGSGRGGTSTKATKALNQGLAISQKQASRVDRCHCIAESPKAVSKT